MPTNLNIDDQLLNEARRLGGKEPFSAGDIDALLVSGVVMIGHAEGKPKNASEIARIVAVPRPTVLRKLDDFQKKGIVERRGSKYFITNPTPPGGDDYIDKCMALIRRAAKL